MKDGAVVWKGDVGEGHADVAAEDQQEEGDDELEEMGS